MSLIATQSVSDAPGVRPIASRPDSERASDEHERLLTTGSIPLDWKEVNNVLSGGPMSLHGGVEVDVSISVVNTGLVDVVASRGASAVSSGESANWEETRG